MQAGYDFAVVARLKNARVARTRYRVELSYSH